jgi:signal transduction histidine kinase
VEFRGMRERLRNFEGTLDIQSNHAGTEIIAAVPFIEAANPAVVIGVV